MHNLSYLLRTSIPVLLGVAVAAPLAHADIPGFQDFSNFTINNGDGGAAPTVSIPLGKINLINGGGEQRSIFDNTPQNITQFTASFTFQGQGGNPDGTCFVIQNNAAGASALGFQDGYSGMIKSAAVALELDNSGNTNTALYTSGNLGGATSSSPVALFTDDPINVSLAYNGSLLNETLVDSTTLASFNTSYVVNLPSVVGTTTAIVGFTASSNFGSSQSISNFQFTSVPEPASIVLFGAGAMSLLAYLSMRRSCA